mmetsp:Transcript_41572/g.98524  ORF Transcript_41572/g.98524 Transcript_41572/m.98524 type:complete len:602 (+) Transcript_41572:314-2119(+)
MLRRMIRPTQSIAYLMTRTALRTHNKSFFSTVTEPAEPNASATTKRKLPVDDERTLKHFMQNTSNKTASENIRERRAPKIILPAFDDSEDAPLDLSGKKFSVETYGCQMNVSDSEIVASILTEAGMTAASNLEAADVVLLNTCAIRENAEAKVWDRLRQLKAAKQPAKVLRPGVESRRKTVLQPTAMVGLLGCMAERLKEKLLETDQLVDFVVGPDAYRDLPRVLSAARPGRAAMNVQLSLEETYADIAPLRTDGNGLSAFVSIMRGCNNMCSFCVVPFTRGRERSRALSSIVEEVKRLEGEGYREVTLLGQNVNSYWDKSTTVHGVHSDGYTVAKGFENTYKLREGEGARFVDLLDQVSRVANNMRVRFTSPHPKDFPLPLLQLIAERQNLAKSLHMPLQSGSSAVLQRMRRGYTKEAFLELVTEARRLMPALAISTDVIAGFCGETEAEHEETLDVMRRVKFEQAFMFAYSERSHTHASHAIPDNVPDHVKQRRLKEIIALFREGQRERTEAEVGSEQEVLVEGWSKRSTPQVPQLFGRTDSNKPCVWTPPSSAGGSQGTGVGAGEGGVECKKGDYVRVRVDKAFVATLQVTPLEVLNK